MKKFIALTVVVFASIGLAQLVSAGPESVSGKEMNEVAPAPPPCDWTGFYGGVHVGYGGGDLTWKDVDFGDNEILTTQVQHGVFGGGQLGYNRQLGSSFVLGIQGDFDWSDVGAETRQVESDETQIYNTENDWTATIALRAGFTSWNNRIWTYVTGGAAITHWNYDNVHLEPDETITRDEFKTDETRVNAMVGFGMEYAINCRWSVNVEYRHLFLGRDTITGIALDDGDREKESYDTELHQDSVRASLNYKFW
jgi:outer membrane immunogenic protein